MVLASQGKAFCAGANFGDGSALDREGRRPREPSPGVAPLYLEGNRLFRTKKPIIAAIQGAAVGGGLGLAMVADFRVTCPEARYCANFTRLGFHPGFGLTVTLPVVIGPTKAALMFYTSRRISGDGSARDGACRCACTAGSGACRRDASSPTRSRRMRRSDYSPPATMRGDLADRVRRATEHELGEQTRLRKTDDFKEGVKAVSERRVPNFKGH